MVPAVAVAEALRARGADVGFVVSRGRAGEGVAAAAGFPEDTIPMRGIARRLTLRNVTALTGAAMAVPSTATRPPASARAQAAEPMNLRRFMCIPPSRRPRC